jgi:hypothetical protein
MSVEAKKVLIYNRLEPLLREKVQDSRDPAERVIFEGIEYSLYELRGLINENQREYGEPSMSFGPGFNNNYENYPPLKPTAESIREVEIDTDRSKGAVKKNSLLNPKAAEQFGRGITTTQEEPAKVVEWLTGEDLFKMSGEKPPMLIDGIAPQVGILALVGSSDTGKSMLLRQLAISCVRGFNFLGFKLNVRYAAALLVVTEDEAQNLRWIYGKQTENNPQGLENLHFLFDSEDIIARLEEKLIHIKVDIIIVDAWGDAFTGNQVDSGQIRQKLNEYKALGQKHDCAVAFLHHTGKRTQKLVPSKDNILAGQGFEAKMRLVMELREDIQDPDYRHLCIVKGNYVGKENKNSSFKLFFDPETFLFSNTGERVPFEELATITETGYPAKVPSKKPYEIEDFIHKELLLQVFSGKFAKPKLKDLLTRLSSKYEAKFGGTYGGKRVDALLDYLLNDINFIAKHGVDRSPQAYYYLTFLTTEHPTGYPENGGE